MENDPNTYRNPFRVNEPLTLVGVPLVQALPFIGCLGLGFVTQSFFEYLLVGIFWYNLISYTDKKYYAGYLRHQLWWKGLLPGLTKETKTVQDPMKREFFQ